MMEHCLVLVESGIDMFHLWSGTEQAVVNGFWCSDQNLEENSQLKVIFSHY